MRRWISRVSLLVVAVVGGVLLTLNLSAWAERNASPALPLEDLRAFAEVYDAVKKGYVEPVEDQKLITEAIRGMVSGLDPHSAYLDPEEYQELQVGTQGEFGGLGIEVGMEDGFVKVVSPIEDTPAFRAGIKAGDLIVKIGEESVSDLGYYPAIDKVLGEEGTEVTLTVRRGTGYSEEHTITAERRKIENATRRENGSIYHSQGIVYNRTKFAAESGAVIQILKIEEKEVA